MSKELKDEIRKHNALQALPNLEGGKILVETLKKDITDVINEICLKHKTATHIELVTICVKLNERLNILKMITGAKKRKKAAQEELELLNEPE